MQNLDQQLFVFINSTLSNPVFDRIMPFVTDLHKNPWFLAGTLPLLLAWWVYRQRWKTIPVLLGLVLTIAFVDNFNYRVLKPAFGRSRPAAVEENVNVRAKEFGGHSFPSNHAANNFAGATFLSYCYPHFTLLYLAIASLIAFSRVYVGVHYPMDVVGGAVVGVFFGLFFYKILSILLRKGAKKWSPPSQ